MAIHLQEVEAKKKLEESKHNVMPMKLTKIPEERKDGLKEQEDPAVSMQIEGMLDDLLGDDDDKKPVNKTMQPESNLPGSFMEFDQGTMFGNEPEF